MKLRNKKTGEVVEREEFILIKHIEGDGGWQDGSYHSLTELNEEWEDYKPTEPLIKDEKVRKAVRAWAEANNLDGASYYTSSHHWYLRSFNHREQGIDFWLNLEDESNLTENKYYTITELCGEEEE